MHIETAQDLARAIRGHRKPDLTPRPWQIQRPAETLWWLVPSADWPAYRHGKFVFASAKDSPRRSILGVDDGMIHVDKLFAGVNIEKGFGPVATEVDPRLRRKPDQLIDRGWVWYRLVGETGPTRFARELRDVSSRTTVHLYVVATYVHDRDSESEPERDVIVFASSGTGIRPVLTNRLPIGVLQQCTAAADFPSLAEQLRRVDAYHWVDLYAGTYVAPGDVDVARLFKDVLSHFEPWVVAGPRPGGK